MEENISKIAKLADMLDGQVVPAQLAMKVCIRGIVAGFPVVLEATGSTYPFGVNYFVDTGCFAGASEALKIVIMPKLARGRLSVITRFLFFERRGQKINVPSLDNDFIFKYDNEFLAKKFVQHHGVLDSIKELQQQSHFDEMVIRSKAGITLGQPTPFNALDLDQCLQTFKLLADIAQVLFELF